MSSFSRTRSPRDPIEDRFYCGPRAQNPFYRSSARRSISLQYFLTNTVLVNKEVKVSGAAAVLGSGPFHRCASVHTTNNEQMGKEEEIRLSMRELLFGASEFDSFIESIELMQIFACGAYG